MSLYTRAATDRRFGPVCTIVAPDAVSSCSLGLRYFVGRSLPRDSALIAGPVGITQERMNLSLERSPLGKAVGKTRTSALGALFAFVEEASESCGTKDTRRGGRIGQVPIRGRVEVGRPPDPRVLS